MYHHVSKMMVTITSELEENRRKYDPFQGLSFYLLHSLSKSTTNLNNLSQLLSQFARLNPRECKCSK